MSPNMNLLARNNAVAVNPPVAPININEHGSDWYWAVMSVMFVSMFGYLGVMFRVPRRDRIFHYITMMIVFVAGIAYFTMAADLGGVGIPVEFRRNRPHVDGATREIFYVRYIDWFITTPLIVLDILLTSGLAWHTILFAIACDEIMVVTGLVGALTQSSYKWGYFTIGCVAFFMMAYVILVVGMKHAAVIGSDVKRLFILISFWTIFTWTLYPIAWGLCEGGNVIGADGEAVFYGVLDLLSKPVFGTILLYGHSKIDVGRLGVRQRDHVEVSNGAKNGASPRAEQQP